MRKIGLAFRVLLILGLIGGVCFFWPRPAHFTEYCAFCDSKVLDRQTFYEDDLVLALYTHRPIFPGHCLVIPKRHVERFEMLTEEEITQMGLAIKKINQAVMQVFGTSSYLLLQKNGLEVGQSVPHVHVHYIPREKGDSSTLEFLVKMYLANARGPISSEEMERTVGKLKQGMERD